MTAPELHFVYKSSAARVLHIWDKRTQHTLCGKHWAKPVLVPGFFGSSECRRCGPDQFTNLRRLYREYGEAIKTERALRMEQTRVRAWVLRVEFEERVLPALMEALKGAGFDVAVVREQHAPQFAFQQLTGATRSERDSTFAFYIDLKWVDSFLPAGDGRYVNARVVDMDEDGEGLGHDLR